MRSFKKVLTCIMFIILLSGCARSGNDFKNISSEDLYNTLQNEKDYMLVDVREPQELVDTGIIQGAINIPSGQVESRLNDFPRDRKIIIYCRTGRRSAEAAKILSANGYENVFNLADGITGWPYGTRSINKQNSLLFRGGGFAFNLFYNRAGHTLSLPFLTGRQTVPA